MPSLKREPHGSTGTPEGFQVPPYGVVRVFLGLTLVGGILAGGFAFAKAVWWKPDLTSRPISQESVDRVDPEPIHFEHRMPNLNMSLADSAVIDKLDPVHFEKLSASQALHLLGAFGLDARFRDERFSSGRDLLELLTNDSLATKYFGHPVMLSTRYGVRPASGTRFGRATQAHRDQLFCCLAQLGLAIEFPMVVQGKARQFGDIFRDSIANFHLGQEEIEFTAIAYALYLPPNRAWINKLDEKYTFDDLVEELLRRQPNKSHCCGAHLVEAMIVIDRVDAEFEPILSETSRNRLRERLDLIVNTVLQKQADDGSWGPQWYYDLVSKDARNWTPSDTETEGRLLATGHITQWLAHLSPEQYPLDDSVFRRAVAWLNQTTAEVDQDFVFDNFCPCSHAAWCIDRFGRAAGPPILATDSSRSSAVAK
jgi:hypothetical protein